MSSIKKSIKIPSGFHPALGHTYVLGGNSEGGDQQQRTSTTGATIKSFFQMMKNLVKQRMEDRKKVYRDSERIVRFMRK
jgi:hypothetical protein